MVTIDKEFEQLIPPLADDDYQRLKESLLNEGCRDPITVWHDIIVDGHNRYRICTENNIPYKTKQIEFSSRDEAKLWMIGVQLSRRNMETCDKIILAQRMEPLLKANAKERQIAAGGDRKSQTYKSTLANEIGCVQMDTSDPEDEKDDIDEILAKADAMLAEKDTAEAKNKRNATVREEIAKRVGVGAGTVARFEKVQQEKPELINEIRNHRMTINEAYNKIKAEEKKQKVKAAETKIAEETVSGVKPYLRIGDSVGYKLKTKCDLLLTDPPYSTDVDDIEKFVSDWLYPALNNVKDTGFAYIFIGAYPEEVRAYLNAKIPEHMKLEQMLVWTYKNTLGNNPKDRYKLNYQFCLFYRGVNAPDLNCPLTTEQWAVQEINAPDGRQGDRYHAWQKPMEIAERFIRHSTEKGMFVYDPFACTGTFLLAAAKLGRKSCGLEINEENANIAFERGCCRG